MAEIEGLLKLMEEKDASDLHMKVGMPPRFRVHGDLEDVEGFEPMTRETLERLTQAILTDEQVRRYTEVRELDFAYGDINKGRFRCNYFQENCGPAAVFRRIPVVIPSLRELNLPPVLESFAHLRSGLVLVTGATGSGKTSTLASLIDMINTQYSQHIITLEDPIEYLHPSKKSVVHQRGLHYDFLDFSSGIKAALREDPDVILIGELRDLDAIRLALSAAEAGSLVFSTLHTNGAAPSVDRIIDVFPSDEQAQIRAVLSQCIAGVVSQILLGRTDQLGRIPATELMISTPAVANLIRENKVQEITNVIQAGKAQGMHTLDDSLERLVTHQIASPEEAFSYADNKSRFERLMNQPPPSAR